MNLFSRSNFFSVLAGKNGPEVLPPAEIVFVNYDINKNDKYYNKNIPLFLFYEIRNFRDGRHYETLINKNNNSKE